MPEAKDLRIYPNYSARPKTPHPVHTVVWHQDAGLQADGSVSTAPVAERLDAFGIGKIVNVWTPLVNVTVENGAMKFIPGSQKLGILEHEVGGSYPGVLDGPGKYYANVKAQKM